MLKQIELLRKRIVDEVSKASEKVGEEMENKVKNHIQTDVYDKYDPKVYERTFELRDSVTNDVEVKGDEVIIKVYHDKDEIHPIKKGYKHYSATNNEDSEWYDKPYNEYLPETVHDGTSGDLFGNGEWTKPRPYMDNAYNDIKSGELVEKTLKKELKKRGFEVR